MLTTLNYIFHHDQMKTLTHLNWQSVSKI